MSLRRSPPTNRKAEAAQSSLENDDRLRPTTYTSNVETAPSHTLAGRDSVTHPDESESSLTDALGVAENSKAENTNYSKGLSGFPGAPMLIYVIFLNSILSDLC